MRFERLKFKADYFLYENSNNKILENIFFEVVRGDILLIKGESGKGKSTIINLISKFLNITRGSILYNDINIYDISNEEYYKNVLQMGQKSMILADSIKENILLGDSYNDDELKEVIELSELEKFIEKYGFDYMLNEDGTNISGGERQRINMARIFLRKPELLILDEPLSSLNENIVLKIVKNIKNFIEKYNITLIVISHNNYFDSIATKILTL